MPYIWNKMERSQMPNCHPAVQYYLQNQGFIKWARARDDLTPELHDKCIPNLSKEWCQV